MEDRVHELAVVERIEDGSRDVADTLGHNPDDCRRRDAVNQRLEGDEHAEAHADEAEGLDVRVLLQADEADDGARYGTEPDKDEEPPAPVALLAQGH